jgi:hypothetical protein
MKEKTKISSFCFLLKTVCLMLSLVLLSGCATGEEKATKNFKTEAETKEEVIIVKDFGEIKVGDTVYFGSLDYDGKSETEKEALAWLVLAVEGKKALMITVSGVDSQQYNVEAIATDWEKCSLREWLNGKFLSQTFTEKEAMQIATTTLPWEANPSYTTPAGKTAEDKLFLLSISEAEKYFASDEARLCKPTPLALDYGVYADEESGTCPWWLRNQGSVAECAALVTEFGAVDYSGDGVYCEGSAVRPAMWINLA